MEESTSLQKTGSRVQLITPEQVEEYKSIRERLTAHVKEIQSDPTPKERMKVQEGTNYPYPEFSYMLSQMDKYHPLRTEEVDIRVNHIYHVVEAVVKVTDLLTGEVRTGTDAHRIMFKSGQEKNHSSIVDIGNDMKSAESEALRNAYSRFGVCADVYKKILDFPPTKEQIELWERISLYIGSVIKPTQLTWWAKTQELWKTQTERTATEFLNSLAKVVKYVEPSTVQSEKKDEDNSSS